VQEIFYLKTYGASTVL